jgi:hypothetical protein
MSQGSNSAAIAQWLKDEGYSEDEIETILAQLAERDHQTLSDAIYDLIGNRDLAVYQLIGEFLHK